MATNEILRFAETDTGTNLLTQAEYAADSQRPIGNQPGVARSKLVNKALRQASLIAAGLAEYIADNQANNITDALTPQNIADYLQAALTGALGVTPPQFDNDTSLATTAFVQRALGNHQGGNVISSPGALLASDAGMVYNIGLAGNVTLPALSTVASGTTITFLSGVNGAAIVPASGDVLALGSSAVASIPLNNGDSATIVKAGTIWITVAGSAAGRKAQGDFGSSLSGSGYQKLPSGLIVQWGLKSTSAGSNTTTFPVAFPTACLSAVATRNTGTPATINDIVTVISVATASFVLATAAGGNVYWFAIGY